MSICKITYDGGLASSGKTYNKLKCIKSTETTTVCSAITLKLGGEHEKALEDVFRVDSTDSLFEHKHAVDNLLDYKYAATRLSSVIQLGVSNVVTTHMSLMNILNSADADPSQFGLYLGDVDLFIDEEFQDVLRLFTISITGSTSTLNSIANLGVWKGNPRGLDNNILEVTANNIELIETMIVSSKNPISDVSENMGAFLKFLKDDKYIKLISRNSLKDAKERLDSKGTANFTFVAVFQVSLLMQFKSVHISVADFPHTETALIFDFLKVDVEEELYRDSEYPVIEGKHDNNNLIINYYSDEDWSKRLRDYRGSSSRSNTVKVAEHVRKEVDGRGLIWNANVVDRGQLSEIFKAPNAKLVTDVAGVNAYQDINDAAYMASAKLTSDQRGCLKSIGIDPVKIESARTHLRAYQFLMRSSIRNRDADLSHPVNWHVMDKNTAMYLKSLFPDAEIKHHDVELSSIHSDNEEGRPKGISEERKKRYFKAKRLISEEKLTQKDACKIVGITPQYFRTCKKQLN